MSVREASSHLVSLSGGWPSATVSVMSPKENTQTREHENSSQMHSLAFQIRRRTIFALNPNPRDPCCHTWGRTGFSPESPLFLLGTQG